MARIKGNGVPTRKTKGALGDIYTDTKTGKMYECVFAYRNGSDNMFDCQWSEIPGKGDHGSEIKDKESVKEEVQQPVSTESKTEDVKVESETEKIPEEESEETKVEEPVTPARTNYAAAYNKQNK